MAAISSRKTLIIILVVAFVLRLAWLLWARPVPSSDFAQYLDNARDLIMYGSYGYPEPTAYRLPLYPLMLAGLLLIWDAIAWLSLWSVLLSTVTCLLVYLVASRLGASKAVGLGAALISASFSPIRVLLTRVGV